MPTAGSGARQRRPAVSNLYVIYYGWLIDGAGGQPNQAARAIAAAQPEALVASFYTFEPVHHNLSAQVRELLHAAGTRIFAYVDTGYGTRDLAETEQEATDYLAYDIDGIFFDQVYNFLDDAYTPFYQRLCALVRGRQKTVIMNPGIAEPGEAIMSVTDILMVEHAWRGLCRANAWFPNYPAERFMGNSSNEPDPGAEGHFDYTIDEASAVRDTREAWAAGLGWHFSTDRYILLPDWFSAYAGAVRATTGRASRRVRGGPRQGA